MIKQLFSLHAIFLLGGSPLLAQLDFWNKPNVTAPSRDVAIDRCMKKMKVEVPIFIDKYTDPEKSVGPFLLSDEDLDVEILQYKCKVQKSRFKDRAMVLGYLYWLQTPINGYWGRTEGEPSIERTVVVYGDWFKVP